jgi:hypothetical protein
VGEYFGADISAKTGLDQGHFNVKTLRSQLMSPIMSTSHHIDAHRKLACKTTLDGCLTNSDHGKVFCDHYGGTMWAVFAFCCILIIYNIMMTIIGCCVCCSMDKAKAPGTTGGIQMAVANPAVCMAVQVAAPVSQPVSQA